MARPAPVVHVALVGLMGSGKSTVGALVAAAAGRRLVDVDDVIRERTGRSVRELWEEGGEAAYRDLERDVVVEALRSVEPIVLAVPGGVVLDPAGLASLAAPTVFVIWLRASVGTLVERVADGGHRPLLGDDPAAVLAAQSDDRAGIYEQVADLVLDVDELRPGAAAEQIRDALTVRERHVAHG